MLLKLTLTVSVLLAALGGVAGQTAQAKQSDLMVKCPGVVKGINFYRQATWKWQDKMGISRFGAEYDKAHQMPSCRYAQWAAKLWAKRAMQHRIKFVHFLAAKAKALAAFPPHHALWMCISKYEGAPWSVNPNGHYGMLQMHADWGYGTSHHASDDPQSVQEWAAERAYKASNYSRGFLNGQWFNYDAAAGECLQYA